METSLSASGGSAPYSYQVQGLPKGLNLSGDRIAGTPSEAGSFSVTVTVTDKDGYKAGKTYTLMVAGAPAIAIAPGVLPSGKINLPYVETSLSASGGSAPYSYQVQGLPKGLNLSGDRIAGTPSEAGSFSVTVTVTDKDGYKAGKTYTLMVAGAPAIAIAPGALPSGKINLPYVETSLSASGGIAPYSYQVQGLPKGLNLSGDRIAGTPSEAGSFSVTVTVTDKDGYKAGKTYTLMVAGAPAIAIAPGALPSGKINLPYVETSLSASGGSAPYSYQVQGLPKGLNLSGDRIAGTPSEAGSFSVTVTVTDKDGYKAGKTYTLAVAGAPAIAIAPGALPSGKINLPYVETSLSASGGSAPYSYQVQGLPKGLNLSGDRIAGTPSEAGSFSVTVTVTDKDGYKAGKTYTLAVAGAPAIAIAPGALPSGKINLPYVETSLSASGGSAPYSYQVQGLPKGLNLSGDRIAGTPSEAGSFSVTVTVTDKDGYKAGKTYTLAVAGAPAIAIAPGVLPSGKINLPYVETSLSASGGSAPYSYQVQGLPKGLNLSGDRIAGTPSEAGSFSVTVTVTDKDGYKAGKTYTLMVAGAPAIAIAPGALPSGKINLPYVETSLSASGGIAPYSYQVQGLPKGLNLSGDRIAGTPSEAGSFSVTVTVTDKDGYKAGKTYTLMVAGAPAIAIAPGVLPSGKINLPYVETSLSASGGSAPYSYQVQGLPKGLNLSGDRIAGTPSEAGSFSVTVTVTDKDGYKAGKTYTLAVAEALPVAQSHSMSVIAGTTASLDLTEGATEGPFIDARIRNLPPQTAGRVWIKREGKAYFLYFAASATFSGGTKLTYSLVNARGVSAPATVTIEIVARPDPSEDKEVMGLVRAQVDAANQLAKAQLGNFNQRLAQLHSVGECRANSVGLGLSLDGQILNPNFDVLEKLRNPDLNATCSSFQRRFSLWTNGALAYGSKNEDSNGTHQKNSVNSLSGGIDYRVSSSFAGGIGFGYGRVATDIGERGTRNHGDMFSIAVYGSLRPYQSVFLDGVLGYGWLQFDSNRYVTATGEVATGQRLGKQAFGSVTLGYEHRSDAWLLSPYARLDVAHTKLDAFDEAGAGIFNLAFDNQDVGLLSATIGIRSEYSVPVNWGVLKLHGLLEYSHEYAGTSQARIGYVDLSGLMPYAIQAQASYRDSVKIGAGFDSRISDNWSLGLDYSTEFGTANGTQHSYKWKLSTQFGPGKR